jgi:hypothetical protein
MNSMLLPTQLFLESPNKKRKKKEKEKEKEKKP